MCVISQDTYGSIEKIANFLGKEVTPEQKRQIVEHCSFGQMKANPKTNYSWYKDWGVIKQKEVLILRKGRQFMVCIITVIGIKIRKMCLEMLLVFGTSSMENYIIAISY